MLVSLGTNQPMSANGSLTLPYACRSLQKVFIKIDDAGGSGWGHRVTVQLGSRTIANGISAWGMRGFQSLQGGHESGGTEVQYQIDFGSHQLLDNENVYVTINADANALDAVDISALVDTPSTGEFPVRYTEYSDNTFTAENVLTAISFYNSQSEVDEDNANIEIRDAVSSSSPSLISANNWFANVCQDDASAPYYGLLKKSDIPLTTTFNYPSSATTDRIVVASLMGTNQRAVAQGRRADAIAQSQVGK